MTSFAILPEFSIVLPFLRIPVNTILRFCGMLFLADMLLINKARFEQKIVHLVYRFWAIFYCFCIFLAIILFYCFACKKGFVPTLENNTHDEMLFFPTRFGINEASLASNTAFVLYMRGFISWNTVKQKFRNNSSIRKFFVFFSSIRSFNNCRHLLQILAKTLGLSYFC